MALEEMVARPLRLCHSPRLLLGLLSAALVLRQDMEHEVQDGYFCLQRTAKYSNSALNLGCIALLLN